MSNLNEDLDWNTLLVSEWALPILLYIDITTLGVDLTVLSYQKWSLPILTRYPEVIDWDIICQFEWCLPLIDEYPLMVGQAIIVLCESEWALPWIVRHEQMLDSNEWFILSTQHWALELLERNVEHINWTLLSSQEWAIDLIRKYPDCIDWNAISINAEALDLIRDNLDKVNMCVLIRNPKLMQYDYGAIRRKKFELHDELMRYLYHPTRYGKWLERYQFKREYLE
jgi:hypothetical protein